MPNHSPESLLQRFRKHGDLNALAGLFDHCAPELGRLACHLAGPAATAEDLLQETFLRALQHLDRFEEGRRVLPWLLGILGRCCQELRREERRRRALELPELAVSAPPEAAARATEIQQCLESSLEQLPDSEQVVLRLHLVDGLSAGEIARSLGRPGGTVRSQISRGLEKLRKHLPAVVGVTAAVALGERALAQVREAVLRQARSTAAGQSLLSSAHGLAAAGLVALLLAFGWLRWGAWTAGSALGGSPTPSQPAPRVGDADPDISTTGRRIARMQGARGEVITLLGRLVDVRGQAVQGGIVRTAEGQRFAASSDGSVRIQLSMRPEDEGPDGDAGFRQRFYVEAPGHACRFLEVGVEMPAGPRVLRLGDIVLQRGSRISGRVVDTRGHPLPRVEVVVRAKLLSPDDPRYRDSHVLQHLWQHTATVDVCRSDSEGYFGFSLPGEGEVEIMLNAPGREETQTAPRPLGHGRLLEFGDIVLADPLPASVCIRGRVLGPDATPVRDARGYAARRLTARPDPSLELEIDGESGEFCIRVPDDEPYIIYVASRSRQLLCVSKPVHRGEEGLELVLRPVFAAAAGGPGPRLRRYATDLRSASGTQLEKLEIRSFVPGLASMPCRQGQDEGGAFVLVPPQARSGLIVGARGHVRRQLPLPPRGGTLRAVLEPIAPALQIRGMVLGDGTPAAGAEVTLGRAKDLRFCRQAWLGLDWADPLLLDQVCTPQRSDAEGRFCLAIALPDVPRNPETMFLRVKLAGYAPQLRRLRMFEGGVRPEQIIHLSRGAELQGRLAVPEGISPRGWVVALHAADGDRRLQTLDKERRYHFRHLAPGPAQLVALSHAARNPDSLRAPPRAHTSPVSVLLIDGASHRCDLQGSRLARRYLAIRLVLDGQPAGGWSCCWGRMPQREVFFDRFGTAQLDLAAGVEVPFRVQPLRSAAEPPGGPDFGLFDAKIPPGHTRPIVIDIRCGALRIRNLPEVSTSEPRIRGGKGPTRRLILRADGPFNGTFGMSLQERAAGELYVACFPAGEAVLVRDRAMRTNPRPPKRDHRGRPSRTS